MSHPRSKVLEAKLTSYPKRFCLSYNDKHISPIMLKEPYSTEITNKETSSHGLGFTSCGLLGTYKKISLPLVAEFQSS